MNIKIIKKMSNDEILNFFKSNELDILNETIGRLKVIKIYQDKTTRTFSRADKRYFRSPIILVKCECGKELELSLLRFIKSGIITCGSCPDLKNGIRKSIHYTRAEKILERCNEERHKHYKNYGGRGIKCLLGDTPGEVVLSLLKVPGYKPGLQIDRIDNNGDYTLYHPIYKNEIWIDEDGHQCLGNLRWVTPFYNNMHRSVTINQNTLHTKWRVLKLIRKYINSNNIDLQNYRLLRKSFQSENVYYGQKIWYYILLHNDIPITSVPYYDDTIDIFNYDTFKYFIGSTTIPEMEVKP